MRSLSDGTPPPLVSELGKFRYDRALNVAKAWLLRSALAQIEENDPQARSALREQEGVQVLHALSIAELTAIELLDAANGDRRDEDLDYLRRACGDAFILHRSLPLPLDPNEHRKSLLKLACFGILGDRTADIQRWLREHGLPAPTGDGASWPIRVFASVSDAFLRTIRKSDWNDLHIVASSIAELRQLQATFEKDYIAVTGESKHVAALELVALYHFAKAVETVASFAGKGEPKDVITESQFHFLHAIRAASSGYMVELELLLRWVRAASLRLVQNSIWWLLRSFNAEISKHVRNLASESRAQPMLELLPPQRRAILEDGLLDPAHRAVVVQMPTSSGKTLLAEFRILQARNSFPDCWIAYLAPTRALVNQVALRLRRDLSPLGIKVESAAPALEVDIFEEEWLQSANDADIVVTTPEKLDMLLRGGRRDAAKRPLGLVVVDEAHNIGEGARGMRAELLLAMLNQEQSQAQLLLLTPFIPNGDELAQWLDSERSKSISVLALDWQPNERAIGMVYPVGAGRQWSLYFRTLHTIPAQIQIDEKLPLEGPRPPLSMPISRVRQSRSTISAAAARILSQRSNSCCIVLADSPASAWEIADQLAGTADPLFDIRSDRVALVQRYLRTEFANDFRLIALLDARIGVHHAGLSPEARYLIEWLAELGELKVLAATTTLAQGVNFPVSAIVLATFYHYQPRKGAVQMSAAQFQNIAGRAGRLYQDTLGIVAFACQDGEDESVERFVSQQVSNLASTLEQMVREVIDLGHEINLSVLVRQDERWASFARYLAHAYRLAGSHEEFVARSEKLLQGTWGYRRLSKTQPVAADQLIQATRKYAATLQKVGSGVLSLVDTTGFSAETVMEVLQKRDESLKDPTRWSPSNLFAGSPQSLADMYKLLLGVRELNLTTEQGREHKYLAEVMSSWVRGLSLAEIADKHYPGDDSTAKLTACCRDLFQSLAQNSAWGTASLLSLSGVDLNSVPREEAEQIRTVPAMLFYGVNTVPGVLMRTLDVPRSVAVKLGEAFAAMQSQPQRARISQARDWIRNLPEATWETVRPSGSAMSGADYRRVWRILNGIQD